MDIINKIFSELRVSLGCTEPAAIALAAASARDLLGENPEKISVWVSANFLKNAMGVGIPKTEDHGIDLIAAMGVQCKHPERALEILDSITVEDEKRAKELVKQGKVTIHLAEDVNPVYVKVTVQAGSDEATAIIEGEHHRIVYRDRNGDVVFEDQDTQLCTDPGLQYVSKPIDIAELVDIAMNAPLEQLEKIEEAEKMNTMIANEGIDGNYNLKLPEIYNNPLYVEGFKHLPFSAIIGAACGVEARMSGSGIPVMTNSGSGNQGIIATIPVIEYARELNATREQKIRALFLSHGITVALKSHAGRLSALCGAFYAATGSGCGIVLLRNGGIQEVENTIMNMIANQTGIICDGAKSSCALKTLSTLYTAVISAELALKQKRVPKGDGIIQEEVTCTLKNFERVIQGMKELDKAILDTMVNPSK